MKKLFFFLLLLIFMIGGCATYWYNPAKTLEQAKQELGVNYSHFMDAPLLFARNAKQKGYQELTKDKLPTDIRTQKIDLFGAIYIAGE